MSDPTIEPPTISEHLVLWLESRIPVPFVPKLSADERELQRLYGEWGLIAQIRALYEHQQNPPQFDDDVSDSEA